MPSIIDCCVGKKIYTMRLEQDTPEDAFVIIFDDGAASLTLKDTGYLCCEKRGMTVDGDLSYYEDGVFLGIERKPVKRSQTKESDCHDVAFLDVITSKGVLTIAFHNKHNGYYAGFDLTAILREEIPR